MNYKRAYLYLNISSIILLLILFLAYLKLPKLTIIYDLLSQYKLLYRIPLVICFLAHVVLFIVIGIINRNDPDNHFKKKYNIVIITLILILFAITMFYEYVNGNSGFLNVLIKPFSDFFGFIVIEDGINKILNTKIKNMSESSKLKNEHKVYNNWQLFINNIKRRITKGEITRKDYATQIDFDINFNDFLYFKDDEDDNSRDKFLDLLNVKEDTGYIIWMIIIIILLYYIK